MTNEGRFKSTRRALFAQTVVAGAGLACLPQAAEAQSRRSRARGTVVSPDQPVVRLTSGQARGFTHNGINTFRGIPYGASTAGANRFLPPQPVESWEGVRDFLNYGPQCPFAPASVATGPSPFGPQDAFLLYRDWTPHVSGEDCLRLNVWSPGSSGRRPVMVYMHGGGFFAGSGNDLLAYDGENLARRGDVVVVTHNHRLSAFGFLDLTRYGGKWANSVNVGMQDIVAALRWVRDNIAAFGGDPNNVTIFGQSGGGGKVQALLNMPSAHGLFHKAIVQSGAFRGFGPPASPQGPSVAEQALQRLGVPENNLDMLATVSVEAVSQVAYDLRMSWSPTPDGRVMVAPLGEISSYAREIPLLVGSNLAEFDTAVDSPVVSTYDDAALMADITQRFGGAAAAIIAAYRAEYPHLPPLELRGAISSAPIRDASFALADAKFAADGQAWQYLFNWRTPMLGGTPGCFHSAEIAFVFNNSDLCVNQSGGGPEGRRLGERMSDAWINFARRGDPGHSGIPAWPPCDASHPTMVFDDQCRLVRNPEGAGRALIAAASPSP